MPTDCKRFEKSVAEEGPCRGACKTCFATMPPAGRGAGQSAGQGAGPEGGQAAEHDLLLLTARDDGAAGHGSGGGGSSGSGSSGAGSSTHRSDDDEIREIEAQVCAAPPEAAPAPEPEAEPAPESSP